MRIFAWMQMGSERRETVIEIPTKEYLRVKAKAEEDNACLEVRLEDYVRDWMYAQYGWGWSGAGYTKDHAHMEKAESGGYGDLAATTYSSIPNTRTVKVCPYCRQAR